MSNTPPKSPSSYDPPIWVEERLQRRLKSSNDSLDVFYLGNELWETSGGQKNGFIEYLKFCANLEVKNNCFIDFKTVAVSWNGFKNNSIQYDFGNGFQAYNPFEDEDFKCYDCKGYRTYTDSNLCGSCMRKHQALIAKTVTEFVLE